MSQQTASAISRILRRLGLGQSRADDSLSAVVAQEPIQGTSSEAIIERLVVNGWPAERASYFVHYIDSARILANGLNVRNSQ